MARPASWRWNAMLPRIDCPTVQVTSPLQRVFGIGHRLPADLTSDDMYSDLILSMTLQRRMLASRSLVKFARPP